MNHIVLSLFFCLFLIPAAAQQKERQFNPGNMPRKEIELPASDQSKIKIPYKSIQIYDKRNDTTAVGFTNLSGITAVFALKGGTAASIHSFITTATQFDDTSNQELILMVRKFWFSSEIEHDEIYETNEREEAPFLPGIIAKFEFYVKQNDQYIILHRFDTIIKMTKTLKKTKEELFALALHASIKKTSTIDVQQRLKTGTKRSWNEIDLFSTQYHSMPVQTASVYKKGVYLSYDEFKNNHPSIEEYEIRNGKLGDMLVIKDANGVSYPMRNVWGFCDGKTIYIKTADNFFPLYFYKTAVYTKAIRFLKRSSGRGAKELAYLVLPMPVADGLNKSGALKKYEMLLKPYQIDLETGELF